MRVCACVTASRSADERPWLTNVSTPPTRDHGTGTVRFTASRPSDLETSLSTSARDMSVDVSVCTKGMDSGRRLERFTNCTHSRVWAHAVHRRCGRVHVRVVLRARARACVCVCANARTSLVMSSSDTGSSGSAMPGSRLSRARLVATLLWLSASDAWLLGLDGAAPAGGRKKLPCDARPMVVPFPAL